MKLSLFATLLALSLNAGFARAEAPSTYVVTVVNGSQMPISPMLVYTSSTQDTRVQVGNSPTPGFIQLCQTGNPALRAQELTADATVLNKTQTQGLLMPGESRTVSITVADPMHQAVHLEAMYGKTKDSCATATIGSHSLYALKQQVTPDVFLKDNVVQTGAFLDPALPAGRTYLDPATCADAMDAVTCLRTLASPTMEAAKVRYFSGYLSSVQMLLETRFGASDTQSLIFPTSGALQIDVKMQH